MTTNTLKKLVLSVLDDIKAENTISLDVANITTMTDTMIITSGNSSRHVKAIATRIVDAAKDNRVRVLGTEGADQGEWILVDLGSIIVHIMQPEIRDYYCLEKLWAPMKVSQSSEEMAVA